MMPRATEFTPVFDWSPPRSRKLSLLSFVAGSAMLHALCFYVFQIIYPPTVTLLPPPARVNFITPDSEEGKLLLRWIEAEDPALSSLTQRPPTAASHALPKPEHVPSYRTTQPTLKEIPPAAPDLRVPSSRPPAPVPLPPTAAPPVGKIIPTAVTFFGETAALGAPGIPPLRFAASSKELPQDARFRVGISARGEVRYCFLQDSSGDPALDEQARRHLLLCRFSLEDRGAKIENGLLWATATFEWGNDLADPSPAPPASPAP